MDLDKVNDVHYLADNIIQTMLRGHQPDIAIMACLESSIKLLKEQYPHMSTVDALTIYLVLVQNVLKSEKLDSSYDESI